MDSDLSHDEFVLINNLLKECYDMKEIVIIINKSLN